MEVARFLPSAARPRLRDRDAVFMFILFTRQRMNLHSARSDTFENSRSYYTIIPLYNIIPYIISLRNNRVANTYLHPSLRQEP